MVYFVVYIVEHPAFTWVLTILRQYSGELQCIGESSVLDFEFAMNVCIDYKQCFRFWNIIVGTVLIVIALIKDPKSPN